MEPSYRSSKAPRDPLIGQLLHDRYRIEARIGRGGMGIVYRAEHVLLRRKVAVKMLSDRAFASEELVARFHREATAAAAVGNEHVVGVTDMGQLDDGSFYVVLEYLEGLELGQAVIEQGPFSVGRAVHVVGQLCDALAAVHTAGIVHRDLKPENLFLVERGSEQDFLKVLDFGVCKVLDERRSGERALTRTGESLGTPQFMAPEQVESSATADERTDLYAVGAILYYLLTGQPPFDDTTLPRLLMRICSEPPPPLCSKRPELPKALEVVITRAMQRSPADRYASVAELRAALAPFVVSDPSERKRPPPRAPVVLPIAGPVAQSGADESAEPDRVSTVLLSPRAGDAKRVEFAPDFDPHLHSQWDQAPAEPTQPQHESGAHAERVPPAAVGTESLATGVATAQLERRLSHAPGVRQLGWGVGALILLLAAVAGYRALTAERGRPRVAASQTVLEAAAEPGVVPAARTLRLELGEIPDDTPSAPSDRAPAAVGNESSRLLDAKRGKQARAATVFQSATSMAPAPASAATQGNSAAGAAIETANLPDTSDTGAEPGKARAGGPTGTTYRLSERELKDVFP